MSVPDAPRVDRWASGAAYEPFIGRWSRAIAVEFLAWLAPEAGARWVDVGCGTGALTAAIVARAAPRSVLGVDPAAAFIGYAVAHDAGTRAALAVADARALPIRDAAADLVVSALALNFVPAPAVAAAEMARITCDGGRVAAYVWDYAEGMELLRFFWDAAAAVDPAAGALDEARRFPLCRPEALDALFRGAGLEDVETRAIEVPMPFRDFADLWDPFLGGQGPAPGYVQSLTADGRERLREELRRRLQPHVSEHGTITLRARAWAVCGSRSSGW